MGSIAMGSLVLGVTWIFKVIFEYLEKKFKDVPLGDSSCKNCILHCIRCCIDFNGRFMRYLTRNGYIYMALSGENFYTSTLNAFILILKDFEKFGFVDGIANFFMVLAKCFISCATTVSTFPILIVFFDIDDIYGNLYGIFFFSYLTSYFFIAIIDVSSNTLLQCFLLDKVISEQLDGTDKDHIPPILTNFFVKHLVNQHVSRSVNTSRSTTQSSER